MRARKILRAIIYLLIGIPLLYGIVALFLSVIPVNRDFNSNGIKTIYLTSYRVHLDIVISLDELNDELRKGLVINHQTEFMAFGWGDENFYLNTPTWGDLTFKNACLAMFFESPTLMHVTRYNQLQHDWIEIEVSEDQFQKISSYLNNSFSYKNGQKQLLMGKGYGYFDDFYKANGNYTCFNTCNTWVNSGLKEAGLKACVWTPFDFGVMGKYNK